MNGGSNIGFELNRSIVVTESSFVWANEVKKVASHGQISRIICMGKWRKIEDIKHKKGERGRGRRQQDQKVKKKQGNDDTFRDREAQKQCRQKNRRWRTWLDNERSIEIHQCLSVFAQGFQHLRSIRDLKRRKRKRESKFERRSRNTDSEEEKRKERKLGSREERAKKKKETDMDRVIGIKVVGSRQINERFSIPSKRTVDRSSCSQCNDVIGPHLQCSWQIS